VAAWEAGSAATGTTDEYSDIDLNVLCACDIDEAFSLIESAMPPITHRYVEPAGSVGGLIHRIYFHDDAPKHFFADVGVLLETSRDTLDELMVIERHGNPVVYFDDQDLLHPHPIDKVRWQAKLEARMIELEASFPIYVLQVLKPLDRHRHTGAEVHVELVGRGHRFGRFSRRQRTCRAGGRVVAEHDQIRHARDPFEIELLGERTDDPGPGVDRWPLVGRRGELIEDDDVGDPVRSEQAAKANGLPRPGQIELIADGSGDPDRPRRPSAPDLGHPAVGHGVLDPR